LKIGIARYQPVLDIIDVDVLDKNYFQDNPVEKILNIERAISKKYGDRNVLSSLTVT